MRLNYLFLVALGLILLDASCSEELNPTPYEYTRFLTGQTSKTWKIKYYETTVDGRVVERTLDNCVSDDRLSFSASSDHQHIASNGRIKCYSDEVSSVSSAWSYVPATATLTMIFSFLSDNPIPCNVRKASDDEFQVEIFLDEENRQSYRLQLELVDEE